MRSKATLDRIGIKEIFMKTEYKAEPKPIGLEVSQNELVEATVKIVARVEHKGKKRIIARTFVVSELSQIDAKFKESEINDLITKFGDLSLNDYSTESFVFHIPLRQETKKRERTQRLFEMRVTETLLPLSSVSETVNSDGDKLFVRLPSIENTETDNFKQFLRNYLNSDVTTKQEIAEKFVAYNLETFEMFMKGETFELISDIKLSEALLDGFISGSVEGRLTANSNIHVIKEQRTGTGYSDLTITFPKSDPILLEFKVNKNSIDALKQIKFNGYHAKEKRQSPTNIAFGVNFDSENKKATFSTETIRVSRPQGIVTKISENLDFGTKEEFGINVDKFKQSIVDELKASYYSLC
ncbi:PD-(D/E)XK nuclease domain-containing protein, partial [Wolbachia endosymbiont of Pentidionis agamae]|uniref:PD-(D/E)XK nuclease domain-containing protein n=1 Tax=Wolbachia endosymbiont of Pentidionis agamae TaxID=3110435 RepID=UPI002FD4E3DA